MIPLLLQNITEIFKKDNYFGKYTKYGFLERQLKKGMEKMPIQTTRWVTLHVVFFTGLHKPYGGLGHIFILLFTQAVSPNYIQDKGTICISKFTPL